MNKEAKPKPIDVCGNTFIKMLAQNVFWFEVSMGDAAFVQKVERRRDVANHQ